MTDRWTTPEETGVRISPNARGYVTEERNLGWSAFQAAEITEDLGIGRRRWFLTAEEAMAWVDRELEAEASR